VPLPEFLEKFFDETERQSTSAATSPEAIFSAFVGTLLYSLVRILLDLYNEQVVPNTAPATCSISRTIASDNTSKS